MQFRLLLAVSLSCEYPSDSSSICQVVPCRHPGPDSLIYRVKDLRVDRPTLAMSRVQEIPGIPCQASGDGSNGSILRQGNVMFSIQAY